MYLFVLQIILHVKHFSLFNQIPRKKVYPVDNLLQDVIKNKLIFEDKINKTS